MRIFISEADLDAVVRCVRYTIKEGLQQLYSDRPAAALGLRELRRIEAKLVGSFPPSPPAAPITSGEHEGEKR